MDNFAHFSHLFEQGTDFTRARNNFLFKIQSKIMRNYVQAKMTLYIPKHSNFCEYYDA